MSLPSFDPDTDVPPLYDAPKVEPRPAPSPIHQDRGRKNRRNGADTERLATRMLESDGFDVIAQGGVGRRDRIVSFGEIRWSCEIKGTHAKLTPGFARRAMEQCERQMLKGTLLMVLVREIKVGTKSVWTVVTPDGPLPYMVWVIGVKGMPICLGDGDQMRGGG